MKAKQKMVGQLAEAYNLFIKVDSAVLTGCNFGKSRAVPTKPMITDFLNKLSQSKESFTEGIETEKLKKIKQLSKKTVGSFTISEKMAVLVTEAIDISQPIAKQEDDELEDQDLYKERIESTYLKNKIGQTVEKKWKPNARMAKFTVFDGLNHIQAIEYEQLDMLNDPFNSTLLLSLKPPIEVRQGLILLRKDNCELIHEGTNE